VGTHGRTQGTTAAAQLGAEGVRDLRLLVQMVVLASPTELERLAAQRDGLVAWLARQFPDALTVEDAEDLVADALPVLAADPRLPSGGRRRRNYLRRALRRDALDELRHRYGRNLRSGAREFVPLGDVGALSDAGPAPDSALEAAQARAQRHAAVERTLTRLRPDDAEVLRLKYLEQRAPDEIAAELGLTRSQYQRRLARAGERGFDALTSVEPSPACGPVRQLLRGATRYSRHDAARVDVHLLDCLHCRAYALRARGLLEVISVPVIGAWERLAARVGVFVGRGGGGSVRDAGEAALASGTAVGAGTALTVGLGTKVAVGCAGAVLAAVCAGPLAHQFAPKPTNMSSPRTAERAHSPRRAATAPASPTATTTAVAAARAATPTPTAPASEKPKTPPTQRRESASERRRRQRAASAREFGPEAATPQVTTTANATAASAATAHTAASAPPPPPPPPSTSTRTPSSSFSGEFRP
jgi:RNA polymerase sigma factor (sigma-70 family)